MSTAPIPPEYLAKATELLSTEQVRIGSIYGHALTDSGSIETFARALAEIAAEQYRAGMEAAAQIGASIPIEYGHDGALMHVENMTAGRIVVEIRKAKDAYHG